MFGTLHKLFQTTNGQGPNWSWAIGQSQNLKRRKKLKFQDLHAKMNINSNKTWQKNNMHLISI